MIHLNHKPLSTLSPKERARLFAYVPQMTTISIAFSAMEIVLMGRISRQGFFQHHSHLDRRIAYEAMERLGISHLADRTFQTLSGGERQMTLIARALAQEAPILVLDEPVSGLDFGNQLRLLAILKSLSQSGYAILQTIHFPDHAGFLGGRAVALKEGRVFAEGDSRDVITEGLFEQLYDIKVRTELTSSGFPVTTPEFFAKEVNTII
ncbi:MAG: ABC transporter ATP-binding protein [Campylobacterales bacterium]